nr:MAG TPA: hypothetical protein [Caudoviricetes sp.]
MCLTRYGYSSVTSVFYARKNWHIESNRKCLGISISIFHESL